MRIYKENSPVFSFLERARNHYTTLGISPNDDDRFFVQLGVSKKIYKNWYNTGIKPIYGKFLDLLDELKNVKEDRDKLEKELKELTNKILSSNGSH